MTKTFTVEYPYVIPPAPKFQNFLEQVQSGIIKFSKDANGKVETTFQSIDYNFESRIASKEQALEFAHNKLAELQNSDEKLPDNLYIKVYSDEVIECGEYSTNPYCHAGYGAYANRYLLESIHVDTSYHNDIEL